MDTMETIGVRTADMIDLAIRTERNGTAFYRAAALASQAEAPRALLLRLAAIEDAHGDVFADEGALRRPTRSTGRSRPPWTGGEQTGGGRYDDGLG
jgi:hypothetical protein